MEADAGDARLVDQPPRELRPRALAGRWPERSLTVTGRPLPSPRRAAMATALSGSSSSDAPAPVLQTLRTGQPMLRSIMSAPASATIAAAVAHHLGVVAEELDRDRVLVRVDAQELARACARRRT